MPPPPWQRRTQPMRNPWPQARETERAALQFRLKLPHQLSNQFFVAPVPAPVTFPLRLHQPGLLEDSHVMRNSRLSQLHAGLDIESAKTGFLAQGASASFFERA